MFLVSKIYPCLDMIAFLWFHTLNRTSSHLLTLNFETVTCNVVSEKYYILSNVNILTPPIFTCMRSAWLLIVRCSALKSFGGLCLLLGKHEVLTFLNTLYVHTITKNVVERKKKVQFCKGQWVRESHWVLINKILGYDINIKKNNLVLWWRGYLWTTGSNIKLKG